jgi:hypothetical protein
MSKQWTVGEPGEARVSGYPVRDSEDDLRAQFMVGGDAERYVRECNRKREAGFILSIGLGGAAMSTAAHVREALEGIEQCIADGDRDGNVSDENGNTVGHWSLSEPPPPTTFHKARHLEEGERLKVGDTFELIEAVETMPGDRIEIITEPYSEGHLVDADSLQEVLCEEEV